MVLVFLKSIDFHERGKRHQENVKKLLSSVSLLQCVGGRLSVEWYHLDPLQARRKTAENEKEAKETDKMLASIEQVISGTPLI